MKIFLSRAPAKSSNLPYVAMEDHLKKKILRAAQCPKLERRNESTHQKANSGSCNCSVGRLGRVKHLSIAHETGSGKENTSGVKGQRT